MTSPSRCWKRSVSRMRRRPGASGLAPVSQLAIARSENPVSREKSLRLSPSLERTCATRCPTPWLCGLARGLPIVLLTPCLAFFPVFTVIENLSPLLLCRLVRFLASILACDIARIVAHLETSRQVAPQNGDPTLWPFEVCRKDYPIPAARVNGGRDEELIPIGVIRQAADRLRKRLSSLL